MKLNTDQIEEIEDFIDSKNVEFYDIKVELVDHLASAIEEELTKYPSLTFSDVLLSKYKEFGLFGFSDFVEQRTSAVFSESRKKYWKQFLRFFKIPKLVYTGLIYVLFYFIFQTFYMIHPVAIIGSIIIPLGLYSFIKYLKMKKELKEKLLQKKYYPFWISISGSFLNLFNFIMTEGNKKAFWYQPWFLAGIISIFIICIWAELNTNKTIHQKLRLEYPEAFKTI
ncbi:hypothetical protein [Lacihabitans lacunae]|uniref:Uncharacterized protein n=1 Tax=Lacihabitans lacunae TaxID=1028214 RepID=A0ABV7YXD6_9BACT